MIGTAELPTRSKTAWFPAPTVWWLSPVLITLLVAAASIIPTVLVDDGQYRSLWRTPKSVTPETLLLFGCGASALALGAMVVMAAIPVHRIRSAPWPSLSADSLRFLSRASTCLTSITVVGYAAFAMLILASGLGPAQLVTAYGSGMQLRDVIGTIPGVTTLTQFGVPAVVVSAVLIAHRFSRRELGKLLLVMGLALVRAFLFSERLAILELVVPVIVLLSARLSFRNGWRRRMVQVVPVALLALVIVIFGVFEYFRSWTFYRTHTSSSYPEFILSRFAGYYTTALNNGHLVLEHLNWPHRLPYDTLEAFWVAPGIESMNLYERLGGHAAPNARQPEVSLYDGVLSQFGNPEFNNQSGYVGAFVDYGTVGGLVCFLVLGLIAGLLYSAFRQGRVVGLFFYPVIFLGLLELPRYFYWSQGRSTYAWIGLFVITVIVSRIEVKERHET